MHAFLIFASLFAFQDLPVKPIHDSLSDVSYTEYVLQLFAVISDKNLQKELEILPSQVEEIKDRINNAKQRYQDTYKAAELKYEETNDADRFTETTQPAFREYVRQLNDVLSDVLLPHQEKQLNRTVLWWMIMNERFPRIIGNETRGFKTVLQNSVIKEILEIDQQQSDAIENRRNELQQEYAKELAALHEKYEKQLREELTPAQRRKIKSILGETPSFLFAVPKR